MTLRSKIMLSMLVLMVAFGAFVQFAASSVYRVRYEQLLLDEARSVSREIQVKVNHLLHLGLYLDELYNFGQQLRETAASNEKIRHILITDNSNNVLYDDGQLPAAYGSIKDIEQRLSQADVAEMPILTVEGSPLGRIIVVVNSELVDKEVRLLVRDILTVSFVALFIGVLVLVWLLRNQFARPMADLLWHIDSTDLEKAPDRTRPISQRPDELGRITQAFDTLIARLSETRRALAQHARLLEERVEQRTQELTLANTALQEDICRRKQLERQLDEMAHTDALTGLPNRLFFNDLLNRRVEHYLRHRHRLALMLIDLDGFKAINDTYGHHEGDHVLRTVGERVRDVSRLSDSFSRFGGDEFVMLLEDYESVEDLDSVANKINERITQPIVHDDLVFEVGVSIGIVEAGPWIDSPEALLKAADKQMYIAKRSARPHWRLDPASAPGGENGKV
jgi:diguanylate cyclase (GGDEF)-like protein